MQQTNLPSFSIRTTMNSFGAPTIALLNHIGSATLLPSEFTPGNWDVVCIRGKDCPKHVGNRRFRICIENHVDSYMNAKTRQVKSGVISSIVQSIKESSPETGGFVMKDSKTKRWHRVDNKIARDKVGNALRDAMKLRSSVVDKQDACVSVLRTKSKKFSSAMKKLKSGRRMSPPSSLLHVKLRTVLPSTTLSTSESSSQNSSHQATPLECFSGIILDADNTNTTPVMPTSNTTFTGRGRGLVSVFDMFDGSSNFHDLEPRPLKVFPQ